MKPRDTIGRRRFLGYTAAVSAGLVVGPGPLSWLAGASAAGAHRTRRPDLAAFVDDYLSNTTANLTPDTNAAVRILSGMARLWRTGTDWNTGVALAPDVLRANIRYVVEVTRARTEEQARLAFIVDRRHQSYSVIDGLGPLAALYRSGAKAVTSITDAPDGTPPGRISDTLPADAPAGSALGAGSPDSELGSVVALVNTLRGPHASSNPSKLAYQYPRPWRLTEDSRVVDTGAVDALGFPVYDSDVVVPVQLLRQRSTDPAHDGGYVSGHTNALYLAAIALAYAIPERFQELLACAAEYSDARILAGMHSPVDVIGGRILATALAAAALHDPRYAALKAAARRQTAAYFQARTATTADTLYAYAHTAGPDGDPFADHARNAARYTARLTYVLPRSGRTIEMTVPKGAEVLLETRLPYLDADQRREVLRSTALPSGYALLEGPEQWGRLNLFAAADGYGSFDRDVHVTMNAADGGFNATDTWRNDIDGRGGLVKQGTGALTLAGSNRYCGGTRLEAGILTAASSKALGTGDVDVCGGTLRVLPVGGGVRVGGDYRQAPGTVLEATVRRAGRPAVTVDETATLGEGSLLHIRLDPAHPPVPGSTVVVIRARRLRGRFSAVTVAGMRAVPIYTDRGLSVRLHAS
ncbi:phosphatase PAP2 family protein [Micromonospora deserti]|uniref:Phosphoesterase n=1 Tax=Micromonospora deserti TaxID=2070366 RepID=A0A2W2CLY8_9ACTN|nr:phosphatase PAP2 family protein [Micromonospora deserti]PZF94084.1 phosphoesterase [Micromonospora deserti]